MPKKSKNNKALLPHHRDPLRKKIAVKYAQQEMRKLLPLLRGPKLWKSIDSQIAKWPKELSLRNFWNAIHGISMGFRQKSLIPWITSKNIRWSEKSVQLENLWFGGAIYKKFKSVTDVKKDLFDPKNKRTLQKLKKTVEKFSRSTAPRDDFPIFVVFKGGKLRVIDGNRRLLRAITHKKKSIRAFVGIPKAEPALYEYWLPTQILTDLDFWHKRQSEIGRRTTVPIARTIAELTRDSSSARYDFTHKVIRSGDKARERLLKAFTDQL